MPIANGRDQMTEPFADVRTEETPERSAETCQAACPVCGGKLIEIRHKLQCVQCHTICETCCEGGRG